jgi:hypothetical protein
VTPPLLAPPLLVLPPWLPASWLPLGVPPPLLSLLLPQASAMLAATNDSAVLTMMRFMCVSTGLDEPRPARRILNEDCRRSSRKSAAKQGGEMPDGK